MKIILSEKQLKKLVVEQTWKDNVKSLFQPTTRKFTVPKGEDLTGKFSPFNLAKEIFKLGIKFPDVVLAQAWIESGRFGSNIFQQNNNLFGMKYPKGFKDKTGKFYKRQTTAKGENLNHAQYGSWLDSVRDYKIWQDEILKNRANISKEEYLSLLDKIYCHPPDCMNNKYSSDVKKTLNRANQIIAKAKM